MQAIKTLYELPVVAPRMLVTCAKGWLPEATSIS